MKTQPTAVVLTVICGSLREAIGRFEALRRVLLHQFVLTVEEIFLLKFIHSNLRRYSDCFEDITADPADNRSQPADIGGYYQPALPTMGELEASHLTSTGRTLIRIDRMSDEDGGFVWVVSITRTVPFTQSIRDRALQFCLSPDFADRFFAAATEGRKWDEVFPAELKYTNGIEYFRDPAEPEQPLQHCARPVPAQVYEGPPVE